MTQMLYTASHKSSDNIVIPRGLNDHEESLVYALSEKNRGDSSLCFASFGMTEK